MPKRKKTHVEESSKKRKITPEKNRPAATITKQSSQQKENIPWPEEEVFQLLKNVEDNIPNNDSVSYNCRLEKLNWENIVVENHSMEECQEVWATLYKQVRKFRLLGELVSDMKVVLTQKPKIHFEKPKQPFNSFMFFVEQKRHEVMSENPTLSSTDVSKKLGQMFKELPAKKKEKYEVRAKAAREEYQVKLQAFYAEHPELIPKKKGKQRKSPQSPEKPRGPPEKPKTPFELFVQVENEKNEVSDSRYVQEYRKKWSGIVDRERFFWIQWAEELYVQYRDVLKEYIKIHPSYEPPKIKYILTKKEQEIKERCLGKPDKPPQSSYHLYCKIMMKDEDAQKLGKDLMMYISQKWKECSDEEKKEYKIRVDQMWEEYYKNVDEYVKTLPPKERERVLQEEKRRKKKDTEENKNDVAEKTEKGTGQGLLKPEVPPSTAYKLFLKSYKGELDSREMWNAMEDGEKKFFKDKLEEERNKYIKEYEKYLKSLTREDLEKLGACVQNIDDSSGESESSSSEEESED